MVDPLEQLRQEREQVEQLFGDEPLPGLKNGDPIHLGTVEPVQISEKQPFGRSFSSSAGEFRVFSDHIEVHPDRGNTTHFGIKRILSTADSDGGIRVILSEPNQEFLIVGDVWMLLQVAWSISQGKAPTYFWDQKINELQASGRTSPKPFPSPRPATPQPSPAPTSTAALSSERGWIPYGLAASLVLLAASIGLNIFQFTQDNSNSAPPEPRPAPTTPPPPRTLPTTTSPPRDCHPSYPDVCIPSPPPDLDCQDIPNRRFRVLHDVPNSDPHFFDLEFDGLGCESNR